MTDRDAGERDDTASTTLGSTSPETGGDTDVVLRLPDSLRPALREPLGPIRADLATVPEDAPVVAVGDIVAYHLAQAGRQPSVAVVDRRTQREAVDPAVEQAVLSDDRRRIAVDNPPGTITAPLVAALVDAIEDPDPVVVLVDGEEDLAVLPAVMAAPAGTTVLYGQPEDGVVLVTVDAGTRETVRDLLERMDGDTDRLWSLLGR